MIKKKTEPTTEEKAKDCSADDAVRPTAEHGPQNEALKAAVAEKEDTERRLLRLQADMDNLRKRTAREKDEWWQLATADLLKQLLPVLDNFERALGTAPAEGDEWAQGIIMVARQMQSTLEALGLEEVCNEGCFDPNCHEALMPDADPDKQENMVTAVFEKGYRYKGRLLRPSKVRVSTGGSI
ncbi:MAG TPA: nucleotide exchange factor GrpE [Bacillota bacterium]|nr:nucleotide exchange factor GrpE [Bacillota bacterium]